MDSSASGHHGYVARSGGWLAAAFVIVAMAATSCDGDSNVTESATSTAPPTKQQVDLGCADVLEPAEDGAALSTIIDGLTGDNLEATLDALCHLPVLDEFGNAIPLATCVGADTPFGWSLELSDEDHLAVNVQPEDGLELTWTAERADGKWKLTLAACSSPGQ